MSDLMNVDAAIANILATMPTLPTQQVPLHAALGRTLATTIIADQDHPPFANSALDGYAIRTSDCASASATHPLRLPVSQDIRAGSLPQAPLAIGTVARIMTGAPLPTGADAVIAVEDTDSTWHNQPDAPAPAEVTLLKSAQVGQGLRPAGENVRRGQLILSAGRVLAAMELGALANLGYSSVSVIRQPRIVILSSGDELIEVGQPLQAGQIYDVNSHTLWARCTELGLSAQVLPIAQDSYAALEARFQAAIALNPDCIIASAGVSVGAADYTRVVLEALGEIGFWRINLRPGKPLAFGKLKGIPFFGLPGNPVSALVTFEVLVRPALRKLEGRPSDHRLQTAILGEPLTSDGRRSYIRVILRTENGQQVAYPTGTQSSGAFMSMVMADALLIIPEDVLHVEAGTVLTVQLLK